MVEVERYIPVEIFLSQDIHAEATFKTFVQCFTGVHIHIRASCYRRNLHIGNQVCCLLVIIIKRQCQATIKKAEVGSYVVASSLFPTQVGVRQAVDASFLQTCGTVYTIHTYNQVWSSIVHNVTLDTVRTTERSMVYEAYALHEFLVRQNPFSGYRPCRQPTVFGVATEFVRTV